MASEEEEDETCWECGGHLSYLETKANGLLCVCDDCGEEQLCADNDEEDLYAEVDEEEDDGEED